jgi:hypothetical protein
MRRCTKGLDARGFDAPGLLALDLERERQPYCELRRRFDVGDQELVFSS